VKPGTIVRLTDGRVGTVVYHGLDGYGIVWGRRQLAGQDIECLLSGGVFRTTDDGALEDARHRGLMPEAMLRDTYPSADLECVGEAYEIKEAPDA